MTISSFNSSKQATISQIQKLDQLICRGYRVWPVRTDCDLIKCAAYMVNFFIAIITDTVINRYSK